MAQSNNHLPDAAGDAAHGAGSPRNQFHFSRVGPGLDRNPRPVPTGAEVAPPKRRKPTERKLNISELIKMMYRGRWIILASFILAFAYSIYSTYSKPYIYGSAARMFIEKPPGGSEIASIMASPSAEDHSIANETQFFKSHIVGGHVARLLHEYAEGNWTEVDSLFTNAFGSANAVPPDPKQLSVLRVVDNPKLPNKPGIADTNTLEARASDAVSIAADPSNDYLVVTSEAYTPLDASFLANLYIVCFVMDDQARVRANSTALRNYLATQKERSYDTLEHVENQLRNYLGSTDGMSAEDIAKSITRAISGPPRKARARTDRSWPAPENVRGLYDQPRYGPEKLFRQSYARTLYPIASIAGRTASNRDREHANGE